MRVNRLMQALRLIVVFVFISVILSGSIYSNSFAITSTAEVSSPVTSDAPSKPENTLSADDDGSVTVPDPTKENPTLHLTFAGDLLMHGLQRRSGYIEKNNTYNFDYFFKDIKKFFSGKDFVFSSLETPLVKCYHDNEYTSYPSFKNPPEYLDAIKASGINVLAAASNHSFDIGASGVSDTLKWLDKSKVPYTGIFSSNKTRQSNPVVLLEKNGIKLAFASYTQITNHKVSADKSYMLNLIDFDKIKSDIAYARKNKADLVIVWLHFGNEYERQPNNYQKDVVKKIAELGADIIIGSHPHVLQPMDVLDVGGRKVFVAYSLGNFVSNQYWRYSTDGMILNIDVIKKNGKVDFLSNITYIPTAVVREYTGPVKLTDKVVKTSPSDPDILTDSSAIKGSDVKFRIVPVEEALNNYKKGLDKKLTPNDITRLNLSLSDTLGLLGQSKYFKPFKLSNTNIP